MGALRRRRAQRPSQHPRREASSAASTTWVIRSKDNGRRGGIQGGACSEDFGPGEAAGADAGGPLTEAPAETVTDALGGGGATTRTFTLRPFPLSPTSAARGGWLMSKLGGALGSQLGPKPSALNL